MKMRPRTSGQDAEVPRLDVVDGATDLAGQPTRLRLVGRAAASVLADDVDVRGAHAVASAVGAIPETFVGNAGRNRLDDLLLGRLAALVDADVTSESEHRDSVCRLEDVVQVVRDDHDRETLLAETPDQGEHLLCLSDTQCCRRLVEDHELRVPHHGPRDGDRLALPAGEGRDRLPDRLDRRHPQPGERLEGLGLHRRLSQKLASGSPHGPGTCSARRRGCRRARGPGRRPRCRAWPRPSARGCEPPSPRTGSRRCPPSAYPRCT